MNRSLTTALLTPEEMGSADRAAIAEGVSGVTLMEAAGRAVAREIARRWSRRPVLVACGPGNNGGDGYVVARYLAQWGWPVTLAALKRRPPAPGSDAAHHAALWKGAVNTLSPRLLTDASYALVVDALFGAGLARALSGPALQFVQAVNQLSVPVCSIDLPSGLNGLDGQVSGVAPAATLTVTFFRKKPGHLLFPGRTLCGATVVADIDIPEHVLPGLGIRTFENHPAAWLNAFPWPHENGHKYHRGHALVVGGEWMTGAARLSAQAAARMGAGLVTVAAPQTAWSVYATALQSIMVQAFSNISGLHSILKDDRKNAILTGPGAGAGERTAEHTLLALDTGRACVLDADAISSFSCCPNRLFQVLSAQCVLTPHEGEFSRLFNVTGSKLRRAREAARISGAVVLLKGADTVIARPDGWAAINANAPADLATGGAGDVLAGMITALLAQGMPAFQAACAATWVHGRAARLHGPGLVADDLNSFIPAVLKELKRLVGEENRNGH